MNATKVYGEKSQLAVRFAVTQSDHSDVTVFSPTSLNLMDDPAEFEVSFVCACVFILDHDISFLCQFL